MHHPSSISLDQINWTTTTFHPSNTIDPELMACIDNLYQENANFHVNEKIRILPLWGVGFAQMPSSLWASLKCPYEMSPTRYNAILRFKSIFNIFHPKF